MLSSSPSGSISNSQSTNGSTPSHAGSAFEGGGGVAYHPKDLDQNEESVDGGKMPKLTLMEEVLLLGIKDKQVSALYACDLKSSLLGSFEH